MQYQAVWEADRIDGTLARVLSRELELEWIVTAAVQSSDASRNSAL